MIDGQQGGSRDRHWLSITRQRSTLDTRVDCNANNMAADLQRSRVSRDDPDLPDFAENTQRCCCPASLVGVGQIPPQSVYC